MRPQRIILVRHGESEGNTDETLFERKADHRMDLTERGHEQARAAGRKLREVVGDEALRVYVSSHARTRQTWDAMREALPGNSIRVVEEPRMREQDWGNYQNAADILMQKKARDAYGHFYYRFRHGESGADVYDRVSTFLETMHRDFLDDDYPPNALLVTHGLTTRLFLTRWFHWTVDMFESLENPGHCEMHTLVRGPDSHYALDRPLSQWRPTRE